MPRAFAVLGRQAALLGNVRPVGDRAMRPFWVHQAAEYLIGLALVAQGLQDTEPVVPAVAGVIVFLNAAVARGPLSAFRGIGRRWHRWLDLAVMVAILAAAVQPWIDVTSAGRVVLLVILAPLGFLWFYTDWAERPARRDRRAAQAGPTSASVGRAAGRAAGTAYSAGRAALRRRRER